MTGRRPSESAARAPAGRTPVALLLLATLALAWGCGKPASQLPAVPGDTVDLEVGERQLTAEVVFDAPSRKLGLMHRKRLPEDRGMLFLFPRKEPQSFWMRNTHIPLSIAFIDDDGTILEIQHMKPKDESGTESKHEVRYALEVEKGWFERAGVGPGDRIPDFQDAVRRFPVR